MTCSEHGTHANGTPLTLRPVREQDAPALDALITSLPARDRRWRFHGAVNGVSADRLHAMTRPATPQERAWVVVACLQQGDVLIADVRWAVDETGDGAEFALMVAPAWRRLGVGGHVLAALSRAAGQSGLRWLHGSVLQDNAPMLALVRRCGFLCTPSRRRDGTVSVELLTQPPRKAERPSPVAFRNLPLLRGTP